METIFIAAELTADVTSDSDGYGNLTSSIAICAAILFVSAWLMLRSRGLRGRSRQPSSPSAAVQPSAAEEQHTEHIAEVYETVRELTGQIDIKLRLLDALIRDADRAAARLEAARRGEAAPVRSERSAESCLDEIYLYADYGFSTFDIASRLGVPVESVERILAARK